MNRALLLAASLLLLTPPLAGSLGLSGCSGDGDAAAGGPGGGRGGPPRAMLVRAEPVERGTLEESWRIAGTVTARRSSTLAAGVSARVESVAVREGARVEEGALLVQLDDDASAAALSAARAGHTAAKAHASKAAMTWERVQAVGGEGLVSDEDRDGARLESEVRAADAKRSAAEVARLRQAVVDHRVLAPYDALVVARSVDEGSWVTPGRALLQVVEVGRPEVELRMPAARLRRLTPGQSVLIHVSGRRVPAVIDAVVPAVDADSRQGLVRVAPLPVEAAEIAGQPELAAAADTLAMLLPGAPVEVAITSIAAADALLVPRDALQDGPNGQYVLTVREGKAVLVGVAVVAQAGDRAAVEAADLKEDDRVVTRGGERLRPGQDVRLPEPPPGSGDTASPASPSSSPSSSGG